MPKQQQRIRHVVHRSVPQEIPPLLTEKQMEKLKTVGGIALALIGIAGVVALSTVSPGAFAAIGKLFFRKNRYRKWSPREKEQKVTRTFYYLKDRGYIRMKPTKSDIIIFLTRPGKKKLQKMNLENLDVARPAREKWDGKWWAAAADIPTEDYKWAADLFRQKLKDMKFLSLQRTLWLYPFDPRKEINYLIQYYGIAGFVMVMEINRLDRDDEAAAKKFFRKENIL